MGSPGNPSCLLDSIIIDDLPMLPVSDLEAPLAAEVQWSTHGFDAPFNQSVGADGSFVDSDGFKDSGSLKRVRSDFWSGPASKACREKMRRDKLNDRFLELAAIIEHEKPPKMDKAAILSDAAHMVSQLRAEAQKLKESNESLKEKINELKAEKNELRDEKQRLKVEKESLEQQMKFMNARPSFLPHPPVLPAAFAPQGQVAGQKLMMPVIGYPGFPMWQFMPPADVDTSQDAESCPPVA